MEANGIIPDVIDSAPKEIAKVTLASGATVEVGKELAPMQVFDQPEVSWNGDASSLYTLLMIDPDAPSRESPTMREVCHWLVINIPGSDVAKGQTLVEYIGAGPSEGSGLHRYIFLVFKQADTISTELFISKTTLEGRLKVKTRDYITKFNLGSPVAGNYFQTQFDETVPALRKQMGLTN